MVTRISIITQDDPNYIPLFFKYFFKNIIDDIEIVSVFILKSYQGSLFSFIKKLYNFFGFKLFLKNSLRLLILKTKDKLGIAPYSVESIANVYDIKTHYIKTTRSSSFVNYIKSNDIDVVLSVSSPEIFKGPLLEAPDWGCINVHTAKLPKYRGLLPTFWAMYHGDKEIGVTVHSMEEKVDKGKIILQRTFPIEDKDSLDDVIRKGKKLGGELAAEALKQIEEDTVQLKPMEGESSYFSFPTKEHRKEFQERGGKLL